MDNPQTQSRALPDADQFVRLMLALVLSMLTVKVSDMQATNKEQSIRIQSSGGLTEAQIEKMVEEARQNEEKDKARKSFIEAKNEAETLIYRYAPLLRALIGLTAKLEAVGGRLVEMQVETFQPRTLQPLSLRRKSQKQSCKLHLDYHLHAKLSAVLPRMSHLIIVIPCGMTVLSPTF